MLRYRAWVEANRALVHDHTGGRVGYVHIPDMGPWGFSEFHRGYLSEFNRDGADRRRALQPRRPRFAAADRKARAQTRRLRRLALRTADAVSAGIRRRPDRRADQPVRGHRRRHLQPRLQALQAGAAGRQAHVGRRRSASTRITASSTARSRRSRSSRSGSSTSAGKSRTTAPIPITTSTSPRTTSPPAATRKWRRR